MNLLLSTAESVNWPDAAVIIVLVVGLFVFMGWCMWLFTKD